VKRGVWSVERSKYQGTPRNPVGFPAYGQRLYCAIPYQGPTKGLERSKHSGVIAAFRQHFIKPGLIEAEYSDAYGAVMEDRTEGDYNLEFEPGADQAEHDMARAQRFLTRAGRALQEMGFLP